MPRELSLAKRRSLVKELWKNGTREVKTLHKITGFSIRTLFRWAAQLSKTGDLKQKSRSGRPKCLNPEKR